MELVKTKNSTGLFVGGHAAFIHAAAKKHPCLTILLGENNAVVASCRSAQSQYNLWLRLVRAAEAQCLGDGFILAYIKKLEF